MANIKKMSSVQLTLDVENKEEKKLRGGYYTPQQIANFISDWVVQKKDDHVLEPSCGEGQFINALINKYLKMGVKKDKIPSLITGIELMKRESTKSKHKFKEHNINLKSETIIEGDFFKWSKEALNEQTQYDGVVGNPPFIRFQDFKEEHKVPALALLKRAGVSSNRLVNSWMPFVVGCTMLIKSRGRIGIV